MRKLVIGILAHVDAGKTTLAESILYLTGSTRKLGRVDHKDAFLDTYELERTRGITIFSKQAIFTFKDLQVSLLDTPGHVDFSSEMERTLQVLDYAILVISGSEGVQAHTETLWKLLTSYKIPTFIFVNKMDMPGTDRSAIMSEVKKRLNDSCIDFSEDQKDEEFMENLAMCDEMLLEKYMENKVVKPNEIAKLISERKMFPCYFGSALKVNGVNEFLNGMEQFTQGKTYLDKFGAKVYKIGRDDLGNRLTYMKVTGGSLKVKMLLTNFKENEIGIGKDNKTNFKENGIGIEKDKKTIWEEKVDQIRIYSGVRYETVDEVGAGTVCAVTGLSNTYPGEGLGLEGVSDMPMLEPVLNYQIVLPSDCDAHSMLLKLRQLEEEDPQLHVVWSKQLKEIHVQLMGEVQIDILQNLILERFGIAVEFGNSNIVYKETIVEAIEGIGHYEPLRHYAEVHLLLEPGKLGSGLTFTSDCSEDVLDRNWQRLILSHLEEKEHIGVLTGSIITDMKITLITGRAHQKHTEGGDFRQATYRAIRHGLKMAKNVLLEPFYDFKLQVPSEFVGRAMSDIHRKSGTLTPPELEGEMSMLIGSVPVATMRGYQAEVTAYTKGRGRLFCTLKGYQPCHNLEEVINAIGYDSERDLDNPTSSVFCAHGAGFVVEWDKVRGFMHVESGWKPLKQEEPPKEPVRVRSGHNIETSYIEDKELEAIFVRTFGPVKQRLNHSQSRLGHENKTKIEKDQVNQQINQQINAKNKELIKEYLLVDGYNIIFSWEELNELAKENLEAARGKLMDILCNYQGFTKCIVILVFDAYKVKGGVGNVVDYHNIHVVFTKEAETADQYIEKVTYDIGRKHRVRVATNDALEQLIIMGQGAIRVSANDLKEEIIRIRDQIRTDYLDRQPSGRTYLGEKFSDNILET